MIPTLQQNYINHNNKIQTTTKKHQEQYDELHYDELHYDITDHHRSKIIKTRKKQHYPNHNNIIHTKTSQ